MWLLIIVVFVFLQRAKYTFANMFFNRFAVNFIKYMIIPDGKW